MSSAPRISLAVVGMACRYPGAANLSELWSNILGRRVQFRDMPARRMSADYIDSDPSAPDKTYGRRAAVLDGFQFDPLARRVPKRTAEGTDVVHWLSLEVALAAVEDARLVLDSHDARKQIGVVLGNTLTGEETRANTMRTRWPFVRQALYAAAQQEGLDGKALAAVERRMETIYKSAFPPVTEDTLAGGLSNTIAGRICNYLDLGGGAFTIDGACSSSLLAVTVAGDLLANGRLDVAIVGGVDVSLDPFELVGFAKATALTKDEMRVYDRRGAGFIPGEGCGFVVLKRLADAERDGDRVYATVEGWGISTDGKGALTAPSIDGQTLALRRAYEMAGYAPTGVSFVEGHGTGTKVGDRVELCAIAGAVRHFAADVEPAAKSIGVTSLKSIVGHTKAASGIGGFIKTVLGTSRRIAPPMAGCEQPHEVFDKEAGALFPLRFGKTFAIDAPMRAGVSSMGFGGINCHVTVQSSIAPTTADRTRDERELASWQGAEVFAFVADDADALVAQLDRLAGLARGIAVAELADLAAHWVTLEEPTSVASPLRGAVVAVSPDDLAAKLVMLRAAARTDEGELGKQVWLARPTEAPKAAFLFPGQGSQRAELGLDMFLRFPWARTLLDLADRTMQELAPDLRAPLSRLLLDGGARELDATEIAQPAICLVSMLWFRLLERMGIAPSAVGGHSLGELTALWAGGAYSDATLLRLAAWRGRAMAADPAEPAGMIAVICSATDAEALVREAEGYSIVANYNGPKQQVVAGTASALADVKRLAAARDIRVVDLPVSNAFHSSLVAGASRVLAGLDFLPERTSLTVPLHSGCEPGAVYQEVAVRSYLSEQVLRPVHFEPAFRGLEAVADVVFEVGPGKVLTGLVGHAGTSCLPVAADGSRTSLVTVLAEAWTRGFPVAWNELYGTRTTRKFVPADQRHFYQNPCERLAGRAPAEQKHAAVLEEAAFEPAPVDAAPATQDSAYARIAAIVSDQTGFPPESISPEHLLLDNMNLDSIKSMTLLDEIASAFNIRGKLKPMDLATATIADLTNAVLTALKNTDGKTAAPREDAWVQSFVLDFEPVATGSAKAVAGPALIIAGDDEGELARALQGSFAAGATIVTPGAKLGAARPATVVVVLPHALPDLSASRARVTRLLCDFGQLWGELSHSKDCTNVVFVQRGDGRLGRSGAAVSATAHAAAFAASFSLDEPTRHVFAIDLPATVAASVGASWIAAAVGDHGTTPQLETICFDTAGARYKPVLRVAAEPVDALEVSWTPRDVVLVTGGGKGITAECALAFAQSTGVQLAVLGRSAPPKDPAESSELADALRRYAAAGVKATYFSCDVADDAALARAIGEVEAALGSITGVIHGAGLNKPRRVDEVTYAAAVEEIGPKVGGAQQLLTILGERPLKLFAALTSVIGVAGMMKNAWYAYANEQVDNMLRAYQATHPRTHVVSLAYSAWDEVGMGAKMGSLSFLAGVGMSAIPVEEGIRQFMVWTTRRAADVQIVITGRMGDLLPWRALRPSRIAPRENRFTREIVALEPDVEVIARCTLHADSHPFLRDHDFAGSLLFPTVMGVEAMAEALRLVTGRDTITPLRFSGLELERPIVVKPRGLEIEIRARRVNAEPGEERYRVEIATEESKFATPHFHGEVALGKQRFEPYVLERPAQPLPIVPKTDLYGHLLFQGPRFQLLDAVHTLDDRSCTFGTTSGATIDGPPYLLGDPFARDVLLQAMQLVVTPEEALPIRVRSWRIARPRAGEHVVAYGVLHTRDGAIRGGDVTAFLDDGAVLEQLVGYEVKVLGTRGDWPTAGELAGGNTRKPRPLVATSTPGMYAQLPGAQLSEDGPDGQWRLRLADMVSMRHAASASRHASHAYFVDWMGRLREASVFPIRAELGRDLMTGRWGLVTNGTSLTIDRPVSAGDVIEGSFVVRRRGGTHDATLLFGFEWTRVEGDTRTVVARGSMDTTWVAITGHGQVDARPFPAYFDDFLKQVVPSRDRMLALCDDGHARKDTASPALWTTPRSALAGPRLSEYEVHTGQTHSNLVGNVYYANYSTWQVAAIDAMLKERIPRLYHAFGTDPVARGELRCVGASIRHLREAMPFDTVAVSLHLQELHAGGLRLQCDFWRVDGKERIKLAAGELDAQWSVATDGEWRNESLPPELAAALVLDVEKLGAAITSGQRADS